MGGIVRPFDMKCHTSRSTKKYTKQLELDYPSFGQVIINSILILHYVPFNNFEMIADSGFAKEERCFNCILG